MGACVSSVHKSSATKVHVSSGSNRKPDDHVLIPLSPVKEKLPIVDGNVPVKPQLPPLQSTDNNNIIDFGSKEETFFDSQAWLESDCESDFMSVNGEFTPSRGNTPVHRSFPATTPPIKTGALAIDGHKVSMIVSQPPPSPVKKSKRLSELFSESRRENSSCDDDNGEHLDEKRAVVHVDVLKPKRERWAETVRVHGCLPRVFSHGRSVTRQHMEVRAK
ncbi:uncharacterized protein At3g27210-like [Bidens hawaiensis]|uniref:uncharacterized protein At3g27210-like n=1 Tax=Bidens hawaiensis TaxID=980011 RepID=UPI00404AC105